MPHPPIPEFIRLRQGCKINLGLKIGNLRPDGYHNLKTIFLPLPFPADDIIVQSAPTSGIAMPNTPNPEENLVVKAWHAFAAATGHAPSISVRLIKRIPAGAGLGGGSADAAALLRWLASQIRIPKESLHAIAATTGSDVPFFLENKPCMATGRGEILTPVPLDTHNATLVVVCPPVHCSTPRIFAELDRIRSNNGQKCLTESVGPVKEMCSEDTPLDLYALNLRNDLEAPVYALHPSLRSLRTDLQKAGAFRVAMSGSGCAMYGIFTDIALARTAVAKLRTDGVKSYLLRMQNFGM